MSPAEHRVQNGAQNQCSGNGSCCHREDSSLSLQNCAELQVVTKGSQGAGGVRAFVTSSLQQEGIH